MFSRKPYKGQAQSSETAEAIKAAELLSVGDRVKTPRGMIGKITDINRLTGSTRVKVPNMREESFLASTLVKI